MRISYNIEPFSLISHPRSPVVRFSHADIDRCHKSQIAMTLNAKKQKAFGTYDSFDDACEKLNHETFEHLVTITPIYAEHADKYFAVLTKNVMNQPWFAKTLEAYIESVCVEKKVGGEGIKVEEGQLAASMDMSELLLTDSQRKSLGSGEGNLVLNTETNEFYVQSLVKKVPYVDNKEEE